MSADHGRLSPARRLLFRAPAMVVQRVLGSWVTCWIAPLVLLGGLGCGAKPPTGTPFAVSASDGDATVGGSSEGPSETDDDDDDGDATPSGLPCDVEALVDEHCGGCHGDPASFGAPMPLVDHDHFMVPSIIEPTEAVLDRVSQRLHDDARPMPPTGTLDDAALAVLDAWIADGAPPSDEDCGGDDGDTSDGDPGALPCEPTDIFVAHSDGDNPFLVPDVDDVYMCFTYKSPWAAGTQAIAGGPVVDDERVLHHWILYRTSTPQTDGGFGPCAMPADSTFVTGWAPGGENFVMPEGIGLELAGPDEWLILQVHYNNTAGYTDAFDGSGVAICTAPTPRPITAGVLWLGSVLVGIEPGAVRQEITGNCYTDNWPEELHIMASSPHMHQRGVGFRTEIYRGGSGPAETLVDVPQFSFADQRDYPHDPPVVIRRGDVLSTTCIYDNPGNEWVLFGESTDDEMCFNFATAYPIDALPDRRCGLL